MSAGDRTAGHTAPRPAVGGVDVFVSYTGADEGWATWVAEVLEAAGQVVRIQAWDSPAGENFVVWISEQMEAAARTVAVCSPAYFVSHWCTQEWSGALAGRKLTPLRVADCAIPAVLGTIGYRDLHGVDEPTARRRLLEAVGVAAPARVSAGFPGGVPGQALPRSYLAVEALAGSGDAGVAGEGGFESERIIEADPDG